jgi:hypothetical protein
MTLWEKITLYRWWKTEGKTMTGKGWRTLGFNVLTAVAGFLGTVTQIPGTDPQTLLIINVVGNFILRFITTGPVGTNA